MAGRHLDVDPTAASSITPNREAGQRGVSSGDTQNVFVSGHMVHC